MMFNAPGLRIPPGVIACATLASAAVFGVVLTLLLRARRRPVVTGTAALIGRPGRIIGWTGMEGEVLVQGERWRARATHPLQPGQAVRVVGRQGLVLILEQA
jgi:membrane-bound serine protease (ClpP class)